MTTHTLPFTGEAVRAILADRKTQTRRVLKPQPVVDSEGIKFKWAHFYNSGHVHTWDNKGNGGQNWNAKQHPMENRFAEALRRTPYQSPLGCKPGDRICVAEAWCSPGRNSEGKPIVCYKASGDPVTNGTRWRSPMCMPCWAFRLTLEVVSVRVERLNDISEEDAKAEGCEGGLEPYPNDDPTRPIDPVEEFYRRWNKINAKTFPWVGNPWVRAITFKRLVAEQMKAAMVPS